MCIYLIAGGPGTSWTCQSATGGCYRFPAMAEARREPHDGTHQVVSPGYPAVAGEALEIYITGPDSRVIPARVAIGGCTAEVLWFGNVPGFAGRNQIKVRMSRRTGRGRPVAPEPQRVARVTE